jgi:branched-chain amino acid transport system permease protein
MFGARALDRADAERGAALARLHGPRGRADRCRRAQSAPDEVPRARARASPRSPRCCCSTKCCPDCTPREIDEAVELIRRIRAQGTTIVLVEHVMRVVTSCPIASSCSTRDACSRRAAPPT